MIAAEGISDVFSGEGGPFAPGELVSSYGVSLGPRAGVPSAFDPVTGTVPTVSAGVSVLLNGVPAPIYYVRADQVNAQIPYELEGQQEASITANYKVSQVRRNKSKSPPSRLSCTLVSSTILRTHEAAGVTFPFFGANRIIEHA